ncbi:hypothetical protein EX30DRAFT_23459 [Ascodesmis nigricans]|uniref:Uncharacterized protein n=1 Tax=Ascodesmis nigricans TaxID=341454 RepID=A0A4S2N7X6_9PEZI|nr:hypothetical protein EX30DRAFT_23459 [Ascodesmis nigricans]
MASKILKGLQRLTSQRLFGAKYSLQSYPMLDAQIAADPTHPLFRRQQEKRERLKNTLIIHSIIPKSVAKHATVRNRCRRRLTEAARVALLAQGYDLHGKPIEAQSSKGEKQKSLAGTLLFIPHIDVIIADWDEICGQVKRAVDHFVAIKKRGPTGGVPRTPAPYKGEKSTTWGKKVFVRYDWRKKEEGQRS